MSTRESADEVGWDEARALIAGAARAGTEEEIPLLAARGGVPGSDLLAPRPLPHFDSSAMDGWVVRGRGPWPISVTGPANGGASPIVTGALVPEDASGVIPLEDGIVRDRILYAHDPRPGQHIRQTGEECAAGQVLVAAGTRLTPSHLALLAVAGIDTVTARMPPLLTMLFTGDEIDTTGPPEPGRVRDAFSPILPAMAEGLGARVGPIRHLPDEIGTITAALVSADSPLVLTTGGTGRSGADLLRAAITAAGGRLLFGAVRMRPGHPTLAARLPGGRLVLGLPGNPLAAMLAALSFLPPAIDAVALGTTRSIPAVTLDDGLGITARTRLVPVRRSGTSWAATTGIHPHMLTGLAAAEAVAAVSPGHEARRARLLPFPW